MNFTALQETSIAIKIHLAAAILAILLFLIICFVRRGSSVHKLMGRMWVTIITITAVSSFWISEINHFMGFSAIHLLSIFTLINCYLGVAAIRRGNLHAHRSAMRGIAIGGLLVAGSLSFLPGRVLYHVFLVGLL
jgi:uncharacterized membrane protein